MSRPLVICDCDEVLLHMVAPFRDWLGETQGVRFEMTSSDFAESMRNADTGAPLDKTEIWRLLGAFFDTEMDRQTAIPGAMDALRALSERADVVILTNLADSHRYLRQTQLEGHGLAAKVYTNQGPKGPAIERLIAEFQPSHTIFIDDLPQHHRSARETVGETAGGITTLHLCGEPMLAPHISCAHVAGHADARIDTWAEALPWLNARLDELSQNQEQPA